MTEYEKMLITKYDLLFESRLTRVETTMENIEKNMAGMRADMKDLKNDFRWLFSLMILFGGGLLSLMVKGFHWY